MVPQGSVHVRDDVFSILYGNLAQLPPESYVLICGDYNAHTNILPDYDIENFHGSEGDLMELLPHDVHILNDDIYKSYTTGRLARFSRDCRPPNFQGLQLIDFCKDTGLLIMNGRLGVDKRIGGYTRMGVGESGVVDYVIGSPEMFDMILDFEVGKKVTESDHMPLTFSLMCDIDNAEQSRTCINWDSQLKYQWTQNELPNIKLALCDEIAICHRNKIKDALADRKCTNSIAFAFNSYIEQACKRTCPVKTTHGTRKARGPRWYDRECRNKRSQAIKAGERAATNEELTNLKEKCNEYRACKQRKKRAFKNSCINEIETAFLTNRCDMWRTLSHICNFRRPTNQPEAREFYQHFSKMSNAPDEPFFNKEYEATIKSFLDKYEHSEMLLSGDNTMEMDILNSNFTVQETEAAIDYLKNNKSPGCDNIPAEIIKYCKEMLSDDLTTVFNYIIESRNFPEIWAEGLRSTIFKADQRSVVKNYGGITILSIFAKIFEILVHNRLVFLNEAFCKIDEFNGGFLRGSRTADNMFILNGLIQRQMAMGKPLYVCYVDFSMAFDLVNRHILFYKLIRQGWCGRVDTLRNFYTKTYFRVKVNGLISPPIPNHIGVNQGGNVSGLLFRKYLADLDEYLCKEVGVCLGDTIIAHLLWADDLILVTDSIKGLQKQLDGLFNFCSDNMMIVNETKTKVMVCGSARRDIVVKFNDKVLDVVDQYKYLGNLMKSVKRVNEDVFGANYQYLCNKARQAVFAMFKRLKNIGTLPVKIMIYLFQSLIKPVLVYGSDVWGVNINATKSRIKYFCGIPARYWELKQIHAIS